MDKIVILDLGSSYLLPMVEAIRRQGVYAEILSTNQPLALNKDIKGLILMGDDASSQLNNNWNFNIESVEVPILAIEYATQLIAKSYGAKIPDKFSSGKQQSLLISTERTDPLYVGVDKCHYVEIKKSRPLMLNELGKIFQILSYTDNGYVSSFKIRNRKLYPIYALQFHPELDEYEGDYENRPSLNECENGVRDNYRDNYREYSNGCLILKNFIHLCGINKFNWTPENILNTMIPKLRTDFRESSIKILIPCSGGLRSSILAMILHKAVGDKMTGVFVDTGILQGDFFQETLDHFQGLGLPIEGINAEKFFLDKLNGIKNNSEKKQIIDDLLIEIFQKYPSQYLADSSLITFNKFNNLDTYVPLDLTKCGKKIIYPFADLMNWEIKKIGKLLGLSSSFLNRHPFSRHQLAINIQYEITKNKLNLLRNILYFYLTLLKNDYYYYQLYNAGVSLISENIFVLWALDSNKSPAIFPVDILKKMICEIKQYLGNNIIIVYDIIGNLVDISDSS